MATTINSAPGRFHIEFDFGTFDHWCVFLSRNGMPRYAPKDTEYFAILQQLATRHGSNKLYYHFVLIYERTSSRIDTDVLLMIRKMAEEYGSDTEDIEIWFTVLYAGMIAEENKENAVLKKRIKRLGMHQLLIEKFEPNIAANFSRGKTWRELDAQMREKGF
jgi:hypothetical protein